MSQQVKNSRRHFIGTAAIGLATASTLSRVAQARENPKIASQKIQTSALARLEPLKSIKAGVLNVSYYETGPGNGPVVFLMHGFPYDIYSYIDVAPLLAAKGYRVIVPFLRGHGGTRFIDDQVSRSGQQAALGKDLIDLMDALGVHKAIMAGYDWGGRAACVAAALWPERCVGLVSVNSYLVQDIAHAGLPAPAKVERGFWYQFYFQTERGRAGLKANRHDIAQIMWHDNSPTWKFDNAVYERSAVAFQNPDYVDVVIHSYRHRLGGADGYPEYAELEKRLATLPVITVPTVTLDGDSDGVIPATDGKSSAAKFGGKRVHHIVRGIGHNLPQEAPAVFANAVLEVAAL